MLQQVGKTLSRHFNKLGITKTKTIMRNQAKKENYHISPRQLEFDWSAKIEKLTIAQRLRLWLEKLSKPKNKNPYHL